MDDHVFVCYSRKDEDFVLNLVRNLKNRGVPIWLDQWDIPSGANWPRAIQKALSDCAKLLVILSPPSVDSDEVQAEWYAALDEKKVVVPILYQPCQIPFRLKQIQYIDFTSGSPDEGESLEQVLRALGIKKDAPTNLITQRASESNNAVLDDIYINNLKIYEKLSKRLEIFGEYIQYKKSHMQNMKSNHEMLKEAARSVSSPYQQGMRYSYSKQMEQMERMVEQLENNYLELQDYYTNLKLSIINLKNKLALYRMSGDPAELNEFEEEIKRVNDLKLDPEFVGYLSDKGGFALARQGKYDEAMQVYDDAISLDPSYGSAWHNRGLALEALDRNTEANESYAKAKELGYEGSIS